LLRLLQTVRFLDSYTEAWKSNISRDVSPIIWVQPFLIKTAIWIPFWKVAQFMVDLIEHYESYVNNLQWACQWASK